MTAGPFRPSAHLYDAMYSAFDYESHAATVLGVIRSRCPGAASLLDVACGTGRHLEIWEKEFADLAGLDVDPAMLEVAAGRVPAVPLHQEDMESFDLGREFDAVTCLFSSIGYARTGAGLAHAVTAMAGHLAPGGVLVIEPWLRPEMLEPPYVRLNAVEMPDLVIARTSRLRVSADSPAISELDFDYLVARPDGVEVINERHVMGMFTPDQFLASFAAAGLDAEWDPGGTWIGRGLAIGVRPR